MIRVTRPTLAAWVLLVVGIALLVVGSALAIEAALFALDGATATGVVTAKPEDPKSSVVTVVFATDTGREVTTNLRVGTDLRDRLTVGDPVDVTYVRSLPDALNTLGDRSGGWSAGLWFVPLLVLAVGALFSSLGGWLVTSARRYAKLVSRLGAVGIKTTGTVIDNDARELRIRGNFQRRLRYEYTDNAGTRHRGLSDWMPRAAALRSKPPTRGSVRYDPDDPEVSVWFGPDATP